MPVLKDISNWIEAALGFLYPNVCQICREERAGPQDGYVCQRCSSRPGAVRFVQAPFCQRCGLPFAGEITNEFQCGNCAGLEFHFQYARAAVVAKGLVLDVIHRYKYYGARWLEPFLSQLFLRQAVPVLRQESWDLIVPVPLHPTKKREREFNQAERFARHLGCATGIPVDSRMLRRVLPTATQTHLSRSERASNVSKAFVMRHEEVKSASRIVLVDDVFTTGATTNACAKVLRRNGSPAVCVWTVARGV